MSREKTRMQRVYGWLLYQALMFVITSLTLWVVFTGKVERVMERIFYGPEDDE